MLNEKMRHFFDKKHTRNHIFLLKKVLPIPRKTPLN